MLALAYAATHPDSVASLVLVGCGTFDTAARQRMQAILDERTDGILRQRLERLTEEYPDPNRRFRAFGEAVMSLYFYNCIPAKLKTEIHDARAHHETWNDMVRLQQEGIYPAAFAAIKVPVLMLHGAFDPHPGNLIRDSLAPHLPQLEYREWERCGHYPWLEKTVRVEFFSVLRPWLTEVTR